MNDVLIVDGVEVDPRGPQVVFGDRGFLYGEGAFETLRTYDGVPFAVSEHVALLVEACRSFAPAPLDAAAIEAAVAQAQARRGARESVVRVVVTGGAAAPGALAVAARLSVYVHATDLPPEPRELRARGAVVVSSAPLFTAAGRALGLPFKSLSYLPALALLRAARAQGADEAIVVSASGVVEEGATCNVLLVRGHCLVTPAGPVRRGVTASRLLLAAPSLGLVPERRAVERSELHEADGVFLVSTLREIVPVASLDGQALPMRYPVDELVAALRSGSRRS